MRVEALRDLFAVEAALVGYSIDVGFEEGGCAHCRPGSRRSRAAGGRLSLAPAFRAQFSREFLYPPIAQDRGQQVEQGVGSDESLGDALPPGRDEGQEFPRQRVESVPERAACVEELVREEGQIGIELELPLEGEGPRGRGLVLGRHRMAAGELEEHRVGLRRHYRGAVLKLRVGEFSGKTRGIQKEIAADLLYIAGAETYRVSQLGELVLVSDLVGQVLAPAQRKAGDAPQLSLGGVDVLGTRREARADSRPAQGSRPEPLLHFVEAPAVAFRAACPGAEHLAQADRQGVLKLGSSGDEDSVVLQLLGDQGFLKADHPAFDLDYELEGSDRHRGGEGIIRRLGAVHILDGIEARRLLPETLAEKLSSPRGRDLVEVHVEAGPRPALPDRKGELLVEISLGDLAQRIDETGEEFGIEARLHFLDCRHRGALHLRVGGDELARRRPGAEVRQGLARLRP